MQESWMMRGGFALGVTIWASLVVAGCEAPSPARAPGEAAQAPLEAAKPAARWLLTYASPPGEAEEARVRGVGGEVVRRWDRCAWVILAQLDEEEAKAAALLPGVVAAERDGGGSGHVLTGPAMLGARRVVAEGFEGRSLRGTGQVIAVVDTGVDATHPELAGRVVGWVDLAGPDGMSPGTYAAPVDPVGHGTAVASLAAGSGDGALAGDRVPFVGSAHLYPARGYFAEVEVPLEAPAGVGLEVTVRPGASGASAYRVTWLNEALEEVAEVVLPRGQEEATLLPPEGSGAQSGLRHRVRLAPAPAEGEALVHEDVERQVRTVWPSRDGLSPTLGVAPGAQIYGIKVLDDGNGFGSAEVILDMLTWLYDHAEEEGITVVNASLGFFQGGPMEAVDAAVNRLVEEVGVPFVASVGNTQGPGSAASPSTAALALGVGSVNPRGELTNYTALGGVGWPVQKPDLVAPGGSEMRGRAVMADSSDAACKWYDQVCERPEDTLRGDYLGWWGTSFAAPQVAGVVALLLEADGGLTYGDPAQARRVSAALKMSAMELGDRAERLSPGAPGRADAPWDVFEGWGLVDVGGALGALTAQWPEGEALARGEVSGEVGSRVWARRVTLAPEEVLFWEVRGEAGADLDLWIVAADGEGPGAAPLLLGASAQPTPGAPEVAVTRTGASPVEAVVVVKALQGGGSFTVLRSAAAEGCDVSQVGAPCEAGAGACQRAGVLRCDSAGVEVVCSATPGAPGAETCGDGGDEDCDGSVDEGFEGLGEPCEGGVGVCKRLGSWACDPDGGGLRCEAELGEPGVELCGSGADEDCDGAVDEGFERLGEACEARLEACVNQGALRCDAAQTGLVCSVGAPEASEERCGDGQDQDCDGAVDEGFEGLGEACSVGVGACAAEGVMTCGVTGRVLICDASAGAPGLESCAQPDDEDCDGRVDEGCAASGGGADDGCQAAPGRVGAAGALALRAALGGLLGVGWRRRRAS